MEETGHGVLLDVAVVYGKLPGGGAEGGVCGAEEGEGAGCVGGGGGHRGGADAVLNACRGLRWAVAG